MPPSRSTWAKSFLASPRLSSMFNLIGPGPVILPRSCNGPFRGVSDSNLSIKDGPRRGLVQKRPLPSGTHMTGGTKTRWSLEFKGIRERKILEATKFPLSICAHSFSTQRPYPLDIGPIPAWYLITGKSSRGRYPRGDTAVPAWYPLPILCSRPRGPGSTRLEENARTRTWSLSELFFGRGILGMTRE